MNAPWFAPTSGTVIVRLYANWILAGEYPTDDGAFTLTDWRDAAEAVADRTDGAVAALATMLAQVKAYPAFVEWQRADESRWTVEFSEWFADREHLDWQPFEQVWWKPEGIAA